VAVIDGGRSGSPRVNFYCSIEEVSTDSWKHRWSSHGRILGVSFFVRICKDGKQD
jgi:hypothetical protein